MDSHLPHYILIRFLLAYKLIVSLAVNNTIYFLSAAIRCCFPPLSFFFQASSFWHPVFPQWVTKSVQWLLFTNQESRCWIPKKDVKSPPPLCRLRTYGPPTGQLDHLQLTLSSSSLLQSILDIVGRRACRRWRRLYFIVLPLGFRQFPVPGTMTDGSVSTYKI